MTEAFSKEHSSAEYIISRDAIAALFGLAGTAAAALGVSLDMYGGAPGVGRSEFLLLAVSAGLFGSATGAIGLASCPASA